MQLKSPYPYFGGKSRIMPAVWARLGPDVGNFVDPFFGSGAGLLSRPGWSTNVRWLETVNDKDGFICNFWRAVKAVPDEVAEWADSPALENDLHARHIWLVERKADLVGRLEGNPDYYDAKIAGWWVWGMAYWIGGGFCSGKGPWHSVDGMMVRDCDSSPGIRRRLLELDLGQGVKRKSLSRGLTIYMRHLQARLLYVRVGSGDWSRVCGPTPTYIQGETAVFLDPPYSVGRTPCYAEEDFEIAREVRRWALTNGTNPLMRIALCRYVDEHDGEMLAAGWEPLRWQGHGGMSLRSNGRGRENREREIVWFSPHCLKAGQRSLWPVSLGTDCNA